MYIIQHTTKSHCPHCKGEVELLTREEPVKQGPMFYICWPCKLIAQIGHGEVRKV
jgi:uncharacterized protein with PIN domain